MFVFSILKKEREDRGLQRKTRKITKTCFVILDINEDFKVKKHDIV